MDLVLEDTKTRSITKKEDIPFTAKNSGLYAIVISARCRGEKQVEGTDDEDFRVEIDGRKFAKLSNSKKYSGSPASFSGGQLHNVKKTVYFILSLTPGHHIISLIVDNDPVTAQLESLIISRFYLKSNSLITISPQIHAEDGNNYPWITFVLVDITLSSLLVNINLKRRWNDHDDVKVIIDGFIERNYTSVKYRFWYFVANLLNNETQSATFSPHLPKGLHYIELWADRMPILNSIDLALSISTPHKIQKYKPNKFNHDYNKFDNYITSATNYWNNFFSQQIFPPPEVLDPNLVKAILYRESKLGYYPDANIIDVMQIWDPRNPSKDAILGNTAANEFISPQKIGHMKYSYPKSKTPPSVNTQEDSIFWGVRWLYHKAQHLQQDHAVAVKIPYVRIWHSWRDAVKSYNGNPHLVEDYVHEVFSIYKDGVDLEGNVLWEK